MKINFSKINQFKFKTDSMRMKKIIAMNFAFTILCVSFFSCSNKNKKNEESPATLQADTMEMIRGYIYGLWSMDSGNVLNNFGYYFKPDGTVDFVAADAIGNWELFQKDSIKIVYNSFNEELKESFKIDSISEGRMTIRDKDGSYLFRKVPFGINNEGVVLQGFSGNISPGTEKEYEFDLPAAKKINLKLISSNKEIVFRVFEKDVEVTSTPLKEWTAILIRSGKYKAKIFYPPVKGVKENGEFDLKIIGY